MKKIIQYTAIFALILLTACEQKVENVDPTWARAIYPNEGATVKIDFFKPDALQTFTWETRANSTYKIYFDTDMHFQNPYVFDVGTKDSLKVTNQEFLNVLREVWPDFTSIKRFFWKVEQNTNGEIFTTWRYFNAILAVESFVDKRDGEEYEARQFVLNDGSLMTIMAENLRAKKYSDGTPLPLPYKGAYTSDPIYNAKAGGYYSWATTVRISWDEAKAATLNKENIQGICPDGWHVPSLAEFDKLRRYLGAESGGNLVKDPSYWKTTANITNSTKLNIIASGYYWHEGVGFITQGLDDGNPFTGFWSSTPYLKGQQFAWGEAALDDDKNKATLMSMYDDVEGIYLQGYSAIPGVENRCYPIRCIMDEIK